jgi:hypothetical protein
VSQRKPFQEATSSKLQPRQREDKRRELRHTITLPVRVAGTDCHKGQWSEAAKTVNVSSRGAAIHLSNRVMVGDTLFLELPLPLRFQKTPKPSEIYRTYALVRYIETRMCGEQIVRLQFLGKPIGTN